MELIFFSIDDGIIILANGNKSGPRQTFHKRFNLFFFISKFLKLDVADEALLTIPSSRTKKILIVFNSSNNTREFIIQEEHFNQITVLDSLILSEQNGELLTNWYSKPMSFRRLLIYLHNH